MSKYEKAARRALDEYLRANREEPVFSLYSLSVIADRAAYAAGKKRELFPSLSDYSAVLPRGAKVYWARDGFLSVRNPYSAAQCKGAEEEARFIPGPFDAGVIDLGVGVWSEQAKRQPCV
ncbi:MAG: hypothetical protein QME87_09990 [Bacillota bacterium]|nr:hypothetical protein [Bacillota bacterium]